MAAQPRPLEAQDALDTLVHQFADPLSFYRELIQNAVDAGSPQVEVRLEYREPAAGAPGPGTAVIHVEDWGDGMDRRIIDTKLTRLFSSGKDGDLTKIGRFGIGFVSVFALEPDAVCVDTSRGGENWRVLFKRDRTFERIVRDEPVDGTKIRMFKALPREEFEKLVERSGEVIGYWAGHLRTEVIFQGKPINRPFALDAPCQVRHQEEGTEVVVGYPADGASFAGYYNRGLTLLEAGESPFGGVAFKIDSRYLEHTLTRDNVIRDRAYEKAMAIVRRLVEGPLVERLLDLLEAEATASEPGPLRDYLYRTAWRQLPAKAAPQRKLFRDVAGNLRTPKECRSAARRGELYRDLPGSPVGRALHAMHSVVIDAPDGSPESQLLDWMAQREVSRAGTLFCRPSEVSADRLPAGWPALCEALAARLRADGHRLAGLEAGSFVYPGSSIADRVAIARRPDRTLVPLAEAGTLGTFLLGRRRTLVLHVGHPAVRRLCAAAEREPEFAAYLAAKLFLVGSERTARDDARSAARVWEARCRRTA
ncbi:MAG: ATP-binding protein [Deltaproteobacteria bacterium]|nr:ATP-binding protein [Deltaproteobacteria bacterium]